MAYIYVKLNDSTSPSMKNTSFLALPLLLAACAVGPDFVAPKAPDAPSYAPKDKTVATPGLKDGAAQSFVLADSAGAAWWQLFQSPPLDAFMQRALANNPSLQAAEEHLRAANESLLAAGGALLPELDASLGVVRRDDGYTGGNVGPYTLYNASVGVSYNLDAFGGTRRAIEGAAAQADVAKAQLKAAYLTLEANIVTTAIAAAGLEARLATTRDILKIEEDQLDILKKQLELGGLARQDVLRQQAAVARTRASLPVLEKALAQAQNRLRALAGALPHEDGLARLDIASLHLPEQLPVTLPSSLVRQRPDILAAEAQLHTASAGVGVAEAARYPQITLGADWGRAAPSPAAMFGPPAILWDAGASLLQPLFNGGRLRHEQRAAEANYRAADALYRATVIDAFREVSDALQALEHDARALAAAKAAYDAADDSYQLARQQLRDGAIDSLALLESQNTYQQAKLDLVAARTQRHADTAALFAALGGGWWVEQQSKKAEAPVPAKAPAPAAPLEKKKETNQ